MPTPAQGNLVLSTTAPTVYLSGGLGSTVAVNIQSLPLITVQVTTSSNEDWRDGFAFFEDDEQTLPIDLEGIDFYMQVRHLPPDATVVLSGSSEDGKLVVAANTLVLNYSVDEMKLVRPLDYVFDIVMQAEGRTRVLAQGTLIVNLGVTR